MEVRICCRLVTQVLTLWPVGTIGRGADPFGITPHTSSFIPRETEHEGFSWLHSPLSAAHLSSHGSALEAHDQDDVLKGPQESRNSITQTPYNVPGPSERMFRPIMPSEGVGEYPVSNHTTPAIISSTRIPQSNYMLWSRGLHEESASGSQELSYSPHGGWNRCPNVRKVFV